MEKLDDNKAKTPIGINILFLKHIERTFCKLLHLLLTTFVIKGKFLQNQQGYANLEIHANKYTMLFSRMYLTNYYSLKPTELRVMYFTNQNTNLENKYQPLLKNYAF